MTRILKKYGGDGISNHTAKILIQNTVNDIFKNSYYNIMKNEEIKKKWIEFIKEYDKYFS